LGQYRRGSFNITEANSTIQNGFGLQSLLSCLLHMYAPEGGSVSKHTGVRGDLSVDELKQTISQLESAVAPYNSAEDLEAASFSLRVKVGWVLDVMEIGYRA
jgi:hypothetical protein